MDYIAIKIPLTKLCRPPRESLKKPSKTNTLQKRIYDSEEREAQLHSRCSGVSNAHYQEQFPDDLLSPTNGVISTCYGSPQSRLLALLLLVVMASCQKHPGVEQPGVKIACL